MPLDEAQVQLNVLEGIELTGTVNTPDETLLENIRHNIRLQYPQVKAQPFQKDRVCLVGGGPSLDDTFEELKQLYFEGAKIVTVNGSYQWCIERNLRPSAQIILDARAFNARFVDPPVPGCRYLLASQCHPDVFAAAEGRDVWIWHGVAPDPAVEQELQDYYAGSWHNIGHGPIGGTTVIIRGIALLRTLGYTRFDLFGADSCYLNKKGHAYPQPENAHEKILPFKVEPPGRPDLARTFWCSPWHIKQLECFLQMIRINGNEFLLNVHGDGLLAYALTAGAALNLAPQEQ